ncbi:hypothetical protein BH10ACI1_BH10ACI1_04510 [soil metagenome]
MNQPNRTYFQLQQAQVVTRFWKIFDKNLKKMRGETRTAVEIAMGKLKTTNT